MVAEGTTETVAVVNGKDDVFQPAEKFDKERPGFVFKMGDQGLGYYPDTRGRLWRALLKAEATMNPQAAAERAQEDHIPTEAPKPKAEKPVDNNSELIPLSFTQAKWGITARMTGGPIVITKIKAGGEAEQLGVQVGDVLLEINGIDIEEQRTPALHYVRQGGPQSVVFSRTSAPADAAEGGAGAAGAVVAAGAAGLAATEGGGSVRAIAGELPESVTELSAMLGTAKAKDTVTVAGLKDTDKTLEDGTFDPNSTLVFFNCENCNFIVENYSIKIFVQSCKNCSIVINGKIITATLEIYKSEGVKLDLNTRCGTLQADVVDGLDVTYGKHEHFTMLIWAGCEKLQVGFGDRDDKIQSGFADMAKEIANLTLERSQFKVSTVNNKVIQEPVIRLPNGFTTTVRERDAFDKQQELNMQAMAKTMGITIKPGSKGIKVKPNEKCPCGSGKKFKKCCMTVDGYYKAPDAK